MDDVCREVLLRATTREADSSVTYTVEYDGELHGVGVDHSKRFPTTMCLDTDAGALPKVDEREYNGRVVDVRLNSTCAAVLSGSKVILQTIEVDAQGLGDVPGGRRGKASSTSGGGFSPAVSGGGVGVGIPPGPGPRRSFPEREDRDHGEATAIGLTEAFLIYATKAGTVEFFCLSEWAPLAGVELKHSSPVLRLWPNYLGTRVVFVDGASTGWLYSPASDKLTQVKNRRGEETAGLRAGGNHGMSRHTTRK